MNIRGLELGELTAQEIRLQPKNKASCHSENRKHMAIIQTLHSDVEAVLCAAAFRAASGGAGFALRAPPEMAKTVTTIKFPLPSFSIIPASSRIVIGNSATVSTEPAPAMMSLTLLLTTPLAAAFTDLATRAMVKVTVNQILVSCSRPPSS